MASSKAAFDSPTQRFVLVSLPCSRRPTDPPPQNPLGVRSNGSPLPPLADGTFSGSPFGNTSPLMDRRPSQSVFGAGPSLDYRQSSIPRSPPVGAPLQFGGGGTFAPFSYEHSHTT